MNIKAKKLQKGFILKQKNNVSGFTLIELLVVVAIIAILALIVLLALNPVEMARRSRDSRRLSDLGTARRAIDLALADGQSLPTTAATGLVLDTNTDVTDIGGTGSLDVSKYLSVMPQDPSYDAAGGDLQILTGSGATCAGGTGDKANMQYLMWSDGDTYILRSHMESEDNCNAVTQDGNDNATYEIGTYPGLNAF